MFCNQCGAQIPQNSRICPYCGNAVGGGRNGQFNYPQGMQMQRPAQTRINMVFSSLMHGRTTGAVVEFILWCSVCVMAVLFLVAAVLVDQDKRISVESGSAKFRVITEIGGYQIFYIFIFIFLIGLGVLLAFRLRAIAILYGAAVFQLIMFIVYYVINSGMINSVLEAFENKYSDNFKTSYPVILPILFVVVLLAGLALVTCLSIHMFSRINLGKISAILGMVQTGLTLLLSVLLYTLPSFDQLDYDWSYDWQSVAREVLSGCFSAAVFWFGSILFFLVCAVITVYMALLFFGVIDSQEIKIFVPGMRRGGSAEQFQQNSGFYPGLQCLQGTIRGQTIYLQGQELTIGSQPGVAVILQDSYVSHFHCSIRFNSNTGYYEVLDNSTNGIYDQATGSRFRRGIYTPCPRGMVLCIGSMGQQFRLL